MGYFEAKSDLQFIREYITEVTQLWRLEDAASGQANTAYLWTPRERKQAIQAAAAQSGDYRTVREAVARGQLRAMRLARRHGIPCDFQSFPAPAVGGPILPVNLFQAILFDPSHGGISRQVIYDALIQLEGAAEQNVALERRRLINPVYWLKELLIFTIRIPFLLIEASGFDVGKVEDHFLAKAFKLIEIAAIVYVLYRLGLDRAGFRELLLKVVGKG